MKAKMDILLLDDLELLLREINEFCTSSSTRLDEVPQSLENYIHYVAKTGNTVFPWQHVRPLFKHKLNTAIGQFQGESSSVEPCVHERFDLFRSAPFTIQRLAELVLQPQKHYKTKEKFVCALEKTVFVVSTIEPKSPTEDDLSNGKEGDLDNEHMEEPMTYEESEPQQQHQDLQPSSYSPAGGDAQSGKDVNEVFETVSLETTGDSIPVTVTSSLESSHNIVSGGTDGRDQDSFDTSYVTEMLKLPPVDASIEAVHDVLGYTEPQMHHNINISHVETGTVDSTSADIAELASVGLVVAEGMEEPSSSTVMSNLDSVVQDPALVSQDDRTEEYFQSSTFPCTQPIYEFNPVEEKVTVAPPPNIGEIEDYSERLVQKEQETEPEYVV